MKPKGVIAMRRPKTYFEQIPVEMVKKKIQEKVAEPDLEKKPEIDSVIRGTPAQKTEPYSVAVRAKSMYAR
jgi:hypothetical protein